MASAAHGLADLLPKALAEVVEEDVHIFFAALLHLGKEFGEVCAFLAKVEVLDAGDSGEAGASGG
jgi:hypothetical protein